MVLLQLHFGCRIGFILENKSWNDDVDASRFNLRPINFLKGGIGDTMYGTCVIDFNSIGKYRANLVSCLKLLH
ncbi:unnamed protein product [Larinioides sclopetarius]